MSDFVKDAESKMQKTIEAVKADFASVRAGRANASVLIACRWNITAAPRR